MRLKLFVFILLLLITDYNLFSTEENIDIDFAYYRKVHKLDNGTIHLFIKNMGNKDVVIKEVFLNDEFLNLEKLPNDEVLWFQIIPPSLKPNKIADIMIKLARPAHRLMKVEVKTKRNTILKRVIRPVTSDIQITNISFAQDFKRVYIYLQNNSEKDLKLNKLFLDTQDITLKLEYREYIIKSGKKQLYVVNLDKPLKKGEYISIKAIFDEDNIIESVVRVFSIFPISSWDGDTRQSLNFDPYPFRFTVYKGRYTEIPKDNPTPIVHLMDHPNCKDGKAGDILGTHAKEVIKRQKKAIKRYPEWPTLIYGCEYDKPRAYFVYGELTDAFLVNPYQVIFHNETPERNRYFASLGKLACQPRPLFSTPAAFCRKSYDGNCRFLTPLELRKTVFYELGEGSKGIIYFNKEFSEGRGYSENRDLEDEIGRINWVLQQLKSYLMIGEPMELAHSEDKRLDSYPILAADKAIVLFLINQGGREVQGSTVEIDIPFDLKVKNVYQIRQSEQQIEPYYYKELSEGNRIRLKTNGTGSVEIFLLTFYGE